jgi:UDP-2,4-diacetamido-2,4,6-trideoxy-beta-L-altropyranose hydrolase
MPNKQNILFRADSSSTIGTGHIMRDLVLAKHYSNANIIFATQKLDGNINHKILEDNFTLEILKNNNIEELHKLIKQLKIDMIIIDHYEIDYSFEKQLKTQNPTLKIMVLDDTYEKHYCDILLNHNISGDKKKYKALVPDNCELRCGIQYTLLRDEFYQVKNSQKHKKNTDKISVFIAMGGADHSNITIDILQVLEKFDIIYSTVVTTNANKNLEALQEYEKHHSRMTLHVNTNKIAQLMYESNFAIITPSVTVNEIIFLDVPFIAIKTAENQNDMYEYLKKNDLLVLEKMDQVKLEKDIYKILEGL